MKVVMVNDCSFVGENIIKYLPEEFQVTHIKRTRGLWSKTGGIFWKILHAKADIFHTHYLLQDSYLTLKLKKKQPVVAHAHGSDIRSTLHSKKWGWIVKYIIKNTSKLVLGGNPDLLEKTRQLKPDTIYLPDPIDMKMFTKTTITERKRQVIFHPYISDSRGTQLVLRAFSQLEKLYPNKYELKLLGKATNYVYWFIDKLNLRNVTILNPVEHSKMPKLYQDADIVITNMGIGIMPVTSLEAMACGRLVVEFMKINEFPDYPACRVEQQSDSLLCDIIQNITKEEIQFQGRLGRKYVEKFHDAEKTAKIISHMYRELKS